ncbi:MAG: CoA-binding protein, partial [Chloroflexi bacterium]|nr:CoA-binding protein [Chloroflexota bacterium]
MDVVRKANLDRAFNPRVVAVVGDKKASDYMWLKSVRDVRDAKVYSVQIDESEIPGILELGFPNLKSLREIPEPVDYVICAVPRQVAPRIVQDCIDLKVGAVGLFTSGFAETSEELGIQLQERLTEMCRRSGLNLVGPNCMCLYHAAAGLRHTADQWIGTGGNVSFMSNSGTHASAFVTRARINGIYPHKSISMGNAIALDQADWLEYLGQDPGTQVIGMYLEGTRDGRRFFDVLRGVAARKPVVIWKGGQTPEGARAVASHTGHMASPMALWDALIRQVGAIRVDSLEELMEVLKAILLM